MYCRMYYYTNIYFCQDISHLFRYKTIYLNTFAIALLLNNCRFAEEVCKNSGGFSEYNEDDNIARMTIWNIKIYLIYK